MYIVEDLQLAEEQCLDINGLFSFRISFSCSPTTLYSDHINTGSYLNSSQVWQCTLDTRYRDQAADFTQLPEGDHPHEQGIRPNESINRKSK